MFSGALAHNLVETYDATSISTLMFSSATDTKIFTMLSRVSDTVVRLKTHVAKPTLSNTEEIIRDYLNVPHTNLKIFSMTFGSSVCSFQAKGAPQLYQTTVIDPFHSDLAG